MQPKCPWHQGLVKVPCSLSACEFFAEGCSLHCGFIAYQQLARTLKNNEELSWSLLADWLKADKGELEQQAKNAYDILKRAGVDHFFLGSILPVHQTRYCVVCEAPAVFQEGGFGFCGLACKSHMTLEALTAELLWEHPIKELLGYLKALDFKTVTRYLKISKESFYHLLWCHLGIRQRGTRKKKILPNPGVPSRSQMLRRLHASRLWKQSSAL